MPIRYFDNDKGPTVLEDGEVEDRAIHSPTLLRLYRYWLDRRNGNEMPARADIQPADIPALLPAIFIVDVLPEPRSFQYRLVGTGVAELTGRDLTHKPVDESTYGDNAEFVCDLFSAVVERRVPMLARGSAKWLSASEWKILEMLLLPLGPVPGRVDMILGGINRDQRDPHQEQSNRLLAVSNIEVIAEPQLALQ